MAKKGEKLSKETKKKMSLSKIGKTHSNETKKKLSKINKGITYEEKYGAERAKEIKQKQSLALIGKPKKERTREHRLRLSRSLKKSYKNGRIHHYLGKPRCEETKNKISKKLKNRTWDSILGVEKSKNRKNKMSKKMKNRVVSKSTKKKMSLSKIGITSKLKGKTFNEIYGEKALDQRNKRKICGIAHIGRKQSDKEREMRRKVRIKQLKKQGIKTGMSLGKHETEILDNFEKNIYPYKFIRQYPKLGYWIDGYCPALNLAVEVDEPWHFKNKKNIETDRRRQSDLEKEMKCGFLRLKIPNAKNNLRGT